MKKNRSTVGERLHWAYANLGMAEMAVYNCSSKYSTLHFMVRAKFNKGLNDGTMSPRTMMKDQKVRMRLPMECIYCGASENLAIDHVVPSNRGGTDGGDNAVWACRSCNSSKSDQDLFEWWSKKRIGMPPLFVIRVYLKQAIEYFTSRARLEEPWTEATDTPYDLKWIPEEFLAPSELHFTLYHSRRQKEAEKDGGGKGG
jgi:HNH endonuclease